jgi:co-chaperonin GroES (HSP10)
MDDISRELEREITQLKPSPYKKSRKKSILIVDDFGEMRPAGHLRVLVYLFGVLSLVCLLAAGGLYYFFSLQAVENRRLKNEVAGLTKKVEGLTNEREVLMARLVISGKEPGIAVPSEKPESAAGKSEKKIKEAVPEKPESKAGEIIPETTAAQDSKASVPVVGSGTTDEDKPGTSNQEALESNVSVQKIVAIEKFTVTRDGADGDLLVRFDIRNISDQPGGVSGRIFTILKPDADSQRDWLVVPTVKLDKGVPTQYKKGQYFSIAHFKPVKFRIENQAGPDFFKKASIYIFNENGDLMFERLIDITEEDPNL